MEISPWIKRGGELTRRAAIALTASSLLLAGIKILGGRQRENVQNSEAWRELTPESNFKIDISETIED
jgi:hypothetical protein